MLCQVNDVACGPFVIPVSLKGICEKWIYMYLFFSRYYNVQYFMTLNISSLCIRSMYLHSAIQTGTVSLNINI